MATTAQTLYPTHYTGSKKRKETNLTHPIEGRAKVAQQQKAAKKTTKGPMNAAKK